MQLPKFVLAENSDFPEAIYILHLEFPRFIVDLNTMDSEDPEALEMEIIDFIEDADEQDMQEELEKLVVQAAEFYEREIERYVQDEELED